MNKNHHISLVLTNQHSTFVITKLWARWTNIGNMVCRHNEVLLRHKELDVIVLSIVSPVQRMGIVCFLLYEEPRFFLIKWKLKGNSLRGGMGSTRLVRKQEEVMSGQCDEVHYLHVWKWHNETFYFIQLT